MRDMPLRCSKYDVTGSKNFTEAETGENRKIALSADLLLGGSVACMCSKTKYHASPADLHDERTNRTEAYDEGDFA